MKCSWLHKPDSSCRDAAKVDDCQFQQLQIVIRAYVLMLLQAAVCKTLTSSLSATPAPRVVNCYLSINCGCCSKRLKSRMSWPVDCMSHAAKAFSATISVMWWRHARCSKFLPMFNSMNIAGPDFFNSMNVAGPDLSNLNNSNHLNNSKPRILWYLEHNAAKRTVIQMNSHETVKTLLKL